MVYKDVLRKRAIKSTSLRVADKLSPFHVLLNPIFTEKAYKQTSDVNKYFFRVHQDANKNDVKIAVETVYNLTPENVNIVNVVFKGRANKKLVRRSYKKAIITLKK
ncbi:MAG: 50S ribosomal protein L23 [Patescibacteria group bacterium]